MEILLRIALFLGAVAVGAWCVHNKWVKPETAKHLLWLIFWVGLPITIVGSILSVQFTTVDLVLPMIAAGVAMVCMIGAYLVSYLLNLPRQIAGVIIVGSMIMNTNFTISFIGAWYGQPGVATFSIFDIGNILSLFLIAYPIALMYGGSKVKIKDIIIKTLSVPTVWALFIALALNLNGILLPPTFRTVAQYLSLGIFTIVMFTLGLLINQGLHRSKFIWLGLALRYIVGGLAGWWISTVLGLEGLMRAIVIIGSASPNGYTTLIYARMAKLDQKFAASMISTSLLIGLLVTPILMLILT